MLDLYREIARRRAAGETVALATVIKVRGSTPREPGAKMVVTADGRIFGTIGGGCGEGEVRQAALEVISSRQPRMVHVDLTADTESVTGAICGGTMEVLVEPVA
ncbi:MAG: XdhC family protein [Chloroflexi bacterium]|nr:XdhC family protein [Chloroflexota bacterium]